MSHVPETYTWYVKKPEDSVRTFQAKDGSGALVDLTGYTAYAIVDCGLVFDDEITATIPVPADGKVRVELSQELLAAVNTRYGQFTVMLVAASNKEAALAYGPLVVTQ